MDYKKTMEDVERDRLALQEMADRFNEPLEPDELQALIAEMQTLAAEVEARLQEIARAVEQEQQEALASGAAAALVPSYTCVQLTEDQRARILSETGVTMEVVNIPDSTGVRSMLMPITDPPQVEAIALEQARQIAATRAAEAQARATINDALADYEANASPEAKALLEEAKKDPDFLAGMLAEGEGEGEGEADDDKDSA